MVQMHYGLVGACPEGGHQPAMDHPPAISAGSAERGSRHEANLGAIVAGVIAFSGIYALAASLSVSSNSLGAGTSVVASCTADTLTVTYGTLSLLDDDAGLHGHRRGDQGQHRDPELDHLQQRGLPGDPLRIRAVRSLGEVTGTVSGVANTTGSSFTTASFGTAVNANLITGVAVVIGG